MPCRHDGLLLHAVVACWRRGLAHHWRTVLHIAAGLTLTVAGCATPVRVARVDPREVERQLDSNVISTHHLSEATRIVLHRANLLERFDTDPEGAIASLHRTITAGPADPDMLFALAEMSFLQALGTGQRRILLRHLAEACPQSCVPGNARDRQPLAWRALDAAAQPSPRVARARLGRLPAQDQGGAR